MEARILIAANWKADQIPRKDEWLRKVWHILLRNKLTAINKLRFGD